MTHYQVTAPCVTHIPTVTPGGAALGTFYKGAILPDGVPQDRIDHLLDAGMIAPVGGPEPAADDEPAEEKVGQEETTPTVNSRSSKGDLVEYGVAHGGDRAELEALTRDQLLDRYVRKPE